MCIRDRYQRRVHGEEGNRLTLDDMKRREFKENLRRMTEEVKDDEMIHRLTAKLELNRDLDREDEIIRLKESRIKKKRKFKEMEAERHGARGPAPTLSGDFDEEINDD
eukprot:TRINITY_DN6614_c0_g1_i1.p1 TRINITY_DN6614_c0_g1~~TRINITY_DN6614_c0_g1_i1.p1  ORF type:complete len:108 (+),score=47.36 TRINITY_DN6614_c0_g1_i1:63-386(+)